MPPASPGPNPSLPTPSNLPQQHPGAGRRSHPPSCPPHAPAPHSISPLAPMKIPVPASSQASQTPPTTPSQDARPQGATMLSQSSSPQSWAIFSTCAPSSRYTHHPLLAFLTLRHSPQVYLRLLPVLTNRSSLPPHGASSNATIGYFPRPPSIHGLHSQSASLRTHSHPHLGSSTHSATSESHPSGPALPHPTPARVEKCAMRHLFSASDLDAITRNAEEILEIHESLVHQLRQVVSPFGISMSPREILSENGIQSLLGSSIDVHRAINAVSTVFVDHVRPLLSRAFLF